jgi:signal peptidase I
VTVGVRGGRGVVDFQGLLAGRQAAEQRAHLMREIVETVLLTAFIFLIVHFSVQTFRVQGPSMESGLQDNEYLLVNSLGYIFTQPARGDVIVFHCEDNCRGTSPVHNDYVKRIIGIPGDTVTITANAVIVDGKTLKEPYIQVPPGASENPVVLQKQLGPGQYFVLGDNRLNSNDSRFWGSVPRQDIVGKVVLVFWPMNQIHPLPDFSGVFKDIK